MMRKTGESARTDRRSVRRAAVAGSTAVVSLLLTACVQLPASGPASTATVAPVLGPFEELTTMKTLSAQDLGLPADAESVAVLAADRSAYCVISTKQGDVFDNPVDSLMAGGQKDDHELAVDAAYCELATYPEPVEATDDCNGTNLGFKGGTIILTSDSFTYGRCRVGMTPMEAEFTAGAEARGPMSQLPLLERGQAVELRGFRCGFGREGMICGDLGSSTGFVATREKVENFG